MIPIKIVCECGQKYAFDVEPLGGRMPTAVSCPGCGVDGTAAANAVIAETVPAKPTVTIASGGPLRVNVTAHSNAPVVTSAAQSVQGGRVLLPGQVSATQAEFEAKAKISWGDPPATVIQYLLMQGFDHQEANDLVNGMLKERAKTIRRTGITKIIIGCALICVPIVTLLIFMSIGMIDVKIFGGTVAIGLYGAWMVLQGTFMVIAPKSESGDVAEK